MAKWDKEVQEKKRNKFIRDSGDFSKGDVFKWQSRLQTPESAPMIPTQPIPNAPPPGTPRVYRQPSQPQSFPSQGAVPRNYTNFKK